MEPSYAWLREHFGPENLNGGLRGIERECLRVDAEGRLALTPHPPALGAALTHPYLTTDYSEALLEFVTPPFDRSAATLDSLSELHAFVQQHLPDELLWPASMPCISNDDDAVPIAQYGSSNEGMFRTIYRRGLGYRYGRAMQAIAGVHFNFSPPAAFWPACAQAAGVADTPGFRSERMMGAVRNYRRLAWVVAYLFGASPVIAKSFLPLGHERLQSLDDESWYAPHATSLRMSELGYRNSTQSRLNVSANSLGEYVDQLRTAVTTPDSGYEAIGVKVDGQYRQLNANVLQIENEYYSSIRPKPRNRGLRPVDALGREGVEYLEVRNLDSDAESLVGVAPLQMHAIELLLLVCLLRPSPPITDSEQIEIDRRESAVAWNGRQPGLAVPREGTDVTLRDWGTELAAAAEIIAAAMSSEAHGEVAARMGAMFEEASLTASAVLLDNLASRRLGFKAYCLELAEQHGRELRRWIFEPGREEALEALSRSSLEQVRRLEADTGVDFDQFLRAYFRE